MPRAGKTVRKLALRRRTQAIMQFSVAGLLIAVPVAIPFIVRSRFPDSLAEFSLPIWIYIICCLLAALVVAHGQRLWKRANQADQGAKAEEEIEALLSPLKQQGWRIEYGIRDRQVGDVDVFLISPSDHAYTIDVKSHKGYVYCQHEQLFRKLGKSGRPFEKDFLTQAKKQAVVMRRRKQLKFVTPMIVFANAKVGIRKKAVAGVYVVEGTHLIACLRSLG